ncbi:hypothetical protein IEQ34_003176 [Dendrobium chrysotoxum]|uniref:Uncharacterized protein n=1 Tax=Dendrobium chrysotoxum TaxID=161865 RepID=A0AAV7HKK2_DENCH|nr:hypothetical protein IEQ34_003176 [Dendrobium chrysotoxum]
MKNGVSNLREKTSRFHHVLNQDYFCGFTVLLSPGTFIVLMPFNMIFVVFEIMCHLMNLLLPLSFFRFINSNGSSIMELVVWPHQSFNILYQTRWYNSIIQSWFIMGCLVESKVSVKENKYGGFEKFGVWLDEKHIQGKVNRSRPVLVKTVYTALKLA